MEYKDRLASIAAAMLSFRRARSAALPAELFSEPAWDCLLELFVADAAGKRITGHEVSQRCGVASTTLSRWLLHLSGVGLVIGDGNGDLDDQLTLSAYGLESVERLMEEAGDLQDAIRQSKQAR